MPVPSTKIIDHIVHITPPGTLEETTEQFRQLGFQVVPGGTHSGSFTANALVLFQDGVYLELISYIHPPSSYPPDSPERRKRESSRWANAPPGWVDYACLGTGSESESQSISRIINARAEIDGSGVHYNPEVKGGRERWDGRVVKWIISGPDDKHGNGMLPFFCGDVTPRQWRVPSDNSNTHHPSTALGVAHIRVLADSEAFTSISRQLTTVIGTQPILSTDEEVIWALETVTSVVRQEGARLILSLPEDEEEETFVGTKKSGIYEVGLWVEKEKKNGCVKTPYGSIVWVPRM